MAEAKFGCEEAENELFDELKILEQFKLVHDPWAIAVLDNNSIIQACYKGGIHIFHPPRYRYNDYVQNFSLTSKVFTKKIAALKDDIIAAVNTRDATIHMLDGEGDLIKKIDCVEDPFAIAATPD
ncbi:unnamed protein product, partial [Owenia fusiformis]